jgi:hypothetical protein
MAKLEDAANGRGILAGRSMNQAPSPKLQAPEKSQFSIPKTHRQRMESGVALRFPPHSKTLSRRHRLSTTRVRVPDKLRFPEQGA